VHADDAAPSHELQGINLIAVPEVACSEHGVQLKLPIEKCCDTMGDKCVRSMSCCSLGSLTDNLAYSSI